METDTLCDEKSLYDIEGLGDLWGTGDSFNPDMGDISLVDDSQDWSSFLSNSQNPTVILNDRMMTDAAEFPRLVFQSDHSYSMANEVDSSEIKMEYDKDLDSDCMLAVPMNSISQNKYDTSEMIQIKSEPPSPPSSPCSGSSSASSDFESFDSSESLLSTNCSSSYQQNNVLSMPSSHHPHSLLKKSSLVLATRQSSQNNSSQRRMVYPKVNIKVEPTPGIHFPPTPPASSNGSDSESSGSPSPSHLLASSPTSSSSSKAHHSQNRVIMASVSSSNSNKGLNTSPLISSQPKGATGMLLLTEEEKRTLIAEGYPIPQRLPLTKAEEKSLKKIRRKIKNKISAQESRRKKKEYMDTLEKKVEILQNENLEYKKKVDRLETNNQSLLSQLNHLQTMVNSEGSSKGTRISLNTNCLTPKKKSSLNSMTL